MPLPGSLPSRSSARGSRRAARRRAVASADLLGALAALGHDLRTPLTAIRVAVTNASDGHLDEILRSEQSALAVTEIDRLARLLQEILDMARIETRAVHADRQWVTAGAMSSRWPRRQRWLGTGSRSTRTNGVRSIPAHVGRSRTCSRTPRGIGRGPPSTCGDGPRRAWRW
jgi:signal transduction histidine kinase